MAIMGAQEGNSQINQDLFENLLSQIADIAAPLKNFSTSPADVDTIYETIEGFLGNAIELVEETTDKAGNYRKIFTTALKYSRLEFIKANLVDYLELKPETEALKSFRQELLEKVIKPESKEVAQAILDPLNQQIGGTPSTFPMSQIPARKALVFPKSAIQDTKDSKDTKDDKGPRDHCVHNETTNVESKHQKEDVQAILSQIEAATVYAEAKNFPEVAKLVIKFMAGIKNAGYGFNLGVRGASLVFLRTYVKNQGPYFSEMGSIYGNLSSGMTHHALIILHLLPESEQELAADRLLSDIEKSFTFLRNHEMNLEGFTHFMFLKIVKTWLNNPEIKYPSAILDKIKKAFDRNNLDKHEELLFEFFCNNTIAAFVPFLDYMDTCLAIVFTTDHAKNFRDNLFSLLSRLFSTKSPTGVSNVIDRLLKLLNIIRNKFGYDLVLKDLKTDLMNDVTAGINSLLLQMNEKFQKNGSPLRIYLEEIESLSELITAYRLAEVVPILQGVSQELIGACQHRQIDQARINKFEEKLLLEISTLEAQPVVKAHPAGLTPAVLTGTAQSAQAATTTPALPPTQEAKVEAKKNTNTPAP